MSGYPAQGDPHIQASVTTGIVLEDPWRPLRGHGYGLRGRVLRGALLWPAEPAWDLRKIHALVAGPGGLPEEVARRCLGDGFTFESFLALIHALEERVPTRVSVRGVAIGPGQPVGRQLRYGVALPSHNPRFTYTLVRWLAASVSLIHADMPDERRAALAAAADDGLAREIEAMCLQVQQGGANSLRIARAADAMGLPVHWLAGAILHVGSGRHARLFHSTMTEETPALGVKLARSKMATAALLRMQGLPVPRHVPVDSEDAAVRAAAQIGYPVVVKPDDRDGGAGVHAGLREQDELRRCYRLAAAESKQVLVEKHVDGEDYRLTVEAGRLVKAIRRRPGGVTGDGRSAVADLVQASNAGKASARTTLALDGEALQMLAERGMDAASVPAEGEFVAMRRRSNVSTGGTAEDVMALVHPENARLAIRAAEALRLDLAGVDLIITDIATSWIECTAAICEVNAVPQISPEFAPDLYRDLLRRLIPPPHRLRAVLVLDAEGADGGGRAAAVDAEVDAAAAALQARGEAVLRIRSNGSWLDAERVGPHVGDAFAAAMSAEFNRQASAVVAALSLGQLLADGLPWFHVDEVRIVGAESSNRSVATRQEGMALLRAHLANDTR